MNIAIIVSVVGLILTLLNIWDKINTGKQRIRDDGANAATQSVTFKTDISAIRSGNSSILVQLDKMENKLDNFTERLIKVEISTENNIQRLNKLEAK